MSDTGVSKHDQVLAGLVLSLQAAAFQHLGKFKNPFTDKVERDLEQARGTIDILEMLKVKCRQDTPAEVLRLLDTAVMELQMNYLDEVKKDQVATPDESEGQKAPGKAAEGEDAEEIEGGEAPDVTGTEDDVGETTDGEDAGEVEEQGEPRESGEG